jgi:hypothetical protein
MSAKWLFGRAVRVLAITAAILAVIFGGAAWYMFALPSRSHTGPLPAVTSEESDLAQRLGRHVAAIASEPYNVSHPQALERAATYIESVLTGYGYNPGRHVCDTNGVPVRNIYVTLEAASSPSDLLSKQVIG